MADRHLKLTLRAGNSRPIEAIAFNTLGEEWPQDLGSIVIAYRLDINEYQGLRGLQLIVEHAVPAS